MERYRKRTSTIIIAMGDKTQCYRSLKEVPASLRRKIASTTSGGNCATLLIADENGQEEIRRSLQGRALSGYLKNESRPPRPALYWLCGAALRRFGMEVLLLGSLGAGIWLLLRH